MSCKDENQERIETLAKKCDRLRKEFAARLDKYTTFENREVAYDPIESLNDLLNESLLLLKYEIILKARRNPRGSPKDVIKNSLRGVETSRLEIYDVMKRWRSIANFPPREEDWSEYFYADPESITT